MENKTKKAAVDGAASLNTRLHSTKESMIFEVLKAGKSLNRFDAEHLGDHCLHSTISTLKKKGAEFLDTWEKVPTRFGMTARVKRYRYLGMAS
jgi:hypothetical protein